MADFMGLMKQAAQLQSKMQAMQAELDQIEVEGTAGGGMVTVTLSGKGDLQGHHDRRFADQAGSEKEIVEDLHGRRARRRAAQGAKPMLAEKMKALTGGLPLPPGLKLILMAGGRRRTRNRAPDPAAGAPARARPALGAARGAASDQEARSADGAARRRARDRDGEDPGLQDLRQYRHAEPVHGLHRSAARSVRSSWWWPTSPICGRWSARMRSTAAITCSAARCRRSTASGRDDLTIDALITRAHDPAGEGIDPGAQRHGRRPDHRALHHRPAARRATSR